MAKTIKTKVIEEARQATMSQEALMQEVARWQGGYGRRTALVLTLHEQAGAKSDIRMGLHGSTDDLRLVLAKIIMELPPLRDLLVDALRWGDELSMMERKRKEEEARREEARRAAALRYYYNNKERINAISVARYQQTKQGRSNAATE